MLYLVAVYPMDKKEVRKYAVVKFSSYFQSPAPNTDHKTACLSKLLELNKS
jgi:hypothetical protein